MRPFSTREPWLSKKGMGRLSCEKQMNKESRKSIPNSQTDTLERKEQEI